MNSQSLHDDVTSDKGTAAQLADSDKSADEIVIELYALIYGRFPEDKEREFAVQLIDESSDERRRVVEDLMWSMTNTPEFVIQN